MSTFTTTQVIDHTSDAGFRAWVIDFQNLIQGAGLVQTTDTGQINTATVTRPGTSTLAGYNIYKLPDSSLYFKIQYGTAANPTNPRIDIQTGEGSNGSGTLTGQLSTSTTQNANVTPASTVTTYTSYCCVTNDFFGVLWKTSAWGAGASPCFYIEKTVDNTGAATSLGYVQCRLNGGVGVSFQSVRRSATAATYTATTSFCVVPGLPTSTLDASGNIQVYTHWGTFPTVLPMLHSCTVRLAEIPDLNTFSVAMVGATSHTYLVLGSYVGAGDASASASFKPAFLYE